MSMTPPPGWYRDPAYPLVERWWDGTGWTDHRRQAETVQQPLAARPETPPPGGTGRRARAVALTTAGVVLVSAIVTGAVLLRLDDSDGDATAQTTPAVASPADTGTPTPTASAPSPSAGDPSVVVDQLNGITLPLPDGWTRPKYVTDHDVVMTTPGTYDCPGDPGLCRHGQVSSRTATATAVTSPKALAEGDIRDAADTVYDRDPLGSRPFRGVTSHKLVKTGSVAVAGRAGYLVRWKVTTRVGPGAYVESLAFPSSVGTEALVVVRFAFDAGADGPPLSDMDRITRGIRSVGATGSDGGVGSSIGPSR